MKVTSLLATTTLVIGLVAGQIGSTKPAAAAGETTDLVFLVDGSASISTTDWQIQKDGLKIALGDAVAFPRNGTIAVAVVQWSFVSATELTRVEVPLTVLDSRATVDAIAAQVQAMVQMQSLTNPGDAVRAGTDLLVAEGEDTAEWTLCMSTDGITNSGEELGAAAAYANSNGVDRYTVVAIEDPGVADAELLRNHYGPHVFGDGSVTVVRNDAELADIVISGCRGKPVELRALEVNQAVQDWHNSVPLITDKPTAVRAFVQMPTGVPDQLVIGRLYGTRGGTPLPGSPLFAGNAGRSVVAKQNIAARRKNLVDSLNFELPTGWRSGTVELTFEVTGGRVVCLEPSGPGTDPANNCKVTVSFQDAVTPEVKLIRVGYKDVLPPPEAELYEQLYRFQTMLPVARISATSDTMDTAHVKDPDILFKVNADLAAKRTLDGAGAQLRYYGGMSGFPADRLGGWSSGIPGTVASGFLLDASTAGFTGANRNLGVHEFTHNLGRFHAVDPSLGEVNNGHIGHCGEGAPLSAPGHTPFHQLSFGKRPVLGPLNQGEDNEIWGLDNRMLKTHTNLAVVDPEETFDLMNYCWGGPQGFWPSKFTYTGVIGSLPPPGGASPPGADFMLVNGMINLDANAATLSPVVASTGSVAAPPSGDYRVRLLNASGAELAGADFTPEQGSGAATEPRVALINVPLPKPASPVAAVVVLHNGQQIGRLDATANAPTVQILSPAGGANLTSPTVTLGWQGADADQNPLSYTVLYSDDGGGTWEALAVNTPATTLTVPRSSLAASTNARLRVIASDGVRTAAATSNAFTVANNAPFAVTDHSVQDRVFSSVQNIILRGNGFDPDDGALSLEWISQLDGPLGSGNELTRNAFDLSVGTHQITLRVTDSAGAVAEATQTVHIYRVSPPRPGITIGAGGPYTGNEGAPVSVTGTVSDPDSLGFTTQWSVHPNDPGTCVIADPAALSTTVTCTDNGSYALILTAKDGVSPLTVSETTTVVLGNANPAVSISAPAGGAMFAANAPVTVTAPFTDAGGNDTHSCTVDFGDGTPVVAGQVTQATGSGTCTATHPYSGLGPHTVVAKVTDDNGGFATANVTVVVYLPGEAFALNATGPVTIPRTPPATCPPDQTQTLANFNAAIVSVSGLNASCQVNPGTGQTTAAGSIQQASVLGGLITITGIQSTCVANAGGVTRTSSVGTINGIPIGQGSGVITVPLVAQVFYNENASAGGQQTRNAVRVQTLAGQQIVLGSCRLG